MSEIDLAFWVMYVNAALAVLAFAALLMRAARRSTTGRRSLFLS